MMSAGTSLGAGLDKYVSLNCASGGFEMQDNDGWPYVSILFAKTIVTILARTPGPSGSE
jgi:hypothetical protein